MLLCINKKVVENVKVRVGVPKDMGRAKNFYFLNNCML